MEIRDVESTLSEIENVIEHLDNDYKELGWYLRFSGARLGSALELTLDDVTRAFSDGYTATHHTCFLVDLPGGALTPNAVDYLLKYIVTVREMYLRQCGILDGTSPVEIFIDHRGKPLRTEKVMAAFREANVKAGQGSLIGPTQIRRAVIKLYTEAWRLRHPAAIATLGYIEAKSKAFIERS